jgi:hypothetical protein
MVALMAGPLACRRCKGAQSGPGGAWVTTLTWSVQRKVSSKQ